MGEIKAQLVDWLGIIESPSSPTASSWLDYVEEMSSEPWRMDDTANDSLKVSLYTSESRYLLLVRPEGEGYSLTVYVLSRHPFKDEQPFHEDSFISGGDFSLETLKGCLLAILERELIPRV